MGNVKVLLSDDEPHVRLLLKKALASMNGEIVGEAKDGRETVELYKAVRPDLTLLDINMPLKTGLEALEEIIAHDPKALVIMLTSVADSEYVQRCLTLGAAGYIRKDTPLSEMKRMIFETFQMFKS